MRHYVIKTSIDPTSSVDRRSNVLIHVPRTAGTYFHNCLTANGVPAVDHLERFLGPPGDARSEGCLPKITGQNPLWVSGHMRYGTLVKHFPVEQGNRFFILLRNPFDQLISQINWQINTLCGSYAALAYMPNYQFRTLLRICIETVDHQDDLLNILNRYFGNFLNNQSRSLSLLDQGRLDPSEINDFSDRAFQRLSGLDGFCVEPGLAGFLKDLILWSKEDETTPVSVQGVSQNASLPVLNPTLVSSAAFMNEVFRLQFADFVMYRNAQHLLGGGSSALTWDSFNSLLADCSGILREARSIERQPDSRLFSKARRRITCLIWLARTGDLITRKISLRWLICLLELLPSATLRNLLRGRRSIFWKTASLVFMAKIRTQIRLS